MTLPSSSRLADLVGSAVTALGYEFVACELVPQGQRILLRVYIDAEGGVKISDCEAVSRQIGAVLEVEDPIRGKYFLEVSSPGDTRLLVTKAHYERFKDHRVKVKIRIARDGRSHYTGLLQTVLDENITLLVDGEPVVIAISEIEKANLVPDN